MFNCSKKDLIKYYESGFKDCEPIKDGWSVKSIKIDQTKLILKFEFTVSADQWTLGAQLPATRYLQDPVSPYTAYPEDYLIVEDVTVVKSALDTMMDSASAPATAAVSTVQGIIMIVSIPQAFVLMKVLQTLDFYVYIECKYPSNFAKFLDMITSSVVDYLPNFFTFLIDGEGDPLYDRFREYGLNIHIFANLGQIFSIVCILMILKLMLFTIGRIFKKTGRWSRKIGPDLLFGIFESYHMDSVLSVLIFVA